MVLPANYILTLSQELAWNEIIQKNNSMELWQISIIKNKEENN